MASIKIRGGIIELNILIDIDVAPDLMVDPEALKKLNGTMGLHPEVFTEIGDAAQSFINSAQEEAIRLYNLGEIRRPQCLGMKYAMIKGAQLSQTEYTIPEVEKGDEHAGG